QVDFGPDKPPQALSRMDYPFSPAAFTAPAGRGWNIDTKFRQCLADKLFGFTFHQTAKLLVAPDNAPVATILNDDVGQHLEHGSHVRALMLRHGDLLMQTLLLLLAHEVKLNAFRNQVESFETMDGFGSGHRMGAFFTPSHQ